MKKNKITGGCYCGEVRFSASPEVRVSRRAFDVMPVERINGSRANSYQKLIVIRDGLFNVRELEIGYTIIAINDRFHCVRRRGVIAIAVVSRSPVRDEHEQECE